MVDTDREEPIGRRLGKFQIPHFWLTDTPSLVMSIMGECIILRAEHMLHSDHFEYQALSNHFSEVPPGGAIPEYGIVVSGKDFAFIPRIENPVVFDEGISQEEALKLFPGKIMRLNTGGSAPVIANKNCTVKVGTLPGFGDDNPDDLSGPDEFTDTYPTRDEIAAMPGHWRRYYRD